MGVGIRVRGWVRVTSPSHTRCLLDVSYTKGTATDREHDGQHERTIQWGQPTAGTKDSEPWTAQSPIGKYDESTTSQHDVQRECAEQREHEHGGH